MQKKPKNILRIYTLLKIFNPNFMKKIAFIFMSTILMFSCNKTTSTTKEFKTCYVDTSKLMEESKEAKDIEEKYKEKSKKMDDQLEKEANKLKSDAENFKKEIEKKGQAWAQQKGAELQQRDQQLSYTHQSMLQQLQSQSGKEMDSIVKKYRKMIKDYGKEKGYDYIYGTGEQATVLYAKDSYYITKEIIKLVNSKYNPISKSDQESKKK